MRCGGQVPLITCQPKLSSLSSDAQKEALANPRFAKRATMWASVRKEPFTVRVPSYTLKTASSVLTLTVKFGKDNKLYSALCWPRKSAEPPWAKLRCGSRNTFALRSHAGLSEAKDTQQRASMLRNRFS